jgi:hypothetical protein
VNSIDPPKWQKSSYCSGGQCVEVATTTDGVLVRDSKRPEMSPLAFDMAEWDAFVRGVKAGEFGA